MRICPIAFLALASAAIAAPTVCTRQGNGGGITEDGIKNNNCCTDVTIVFARGTIELGNVGTSAGPPMFKALRSKIGADRVTVQGTAYPADFIGFFAGGVTGASQMANDVKTILQRCPNTKVVVSGYSQGAQVAHNAFKNGLSAANVKAAVVFGDPKRGQAFGNLLSSGVKDFCAKGDQICENPGSFIVLPAHGTYGSNADAAADFIIATLGL